MACSSKHSWGMGAPRGHISNALPKHSECFAFTLLILWLRPDRFELPTFWFLVRRYRVRRCSHRSVLFNFSHSVTSVQAALYADFRSGSGHGCGQMFPAQETRIPMHFFPLATQPAGAACSGAFNADDVHDLLAAASGATRAVTESVSGGRWPHENRGGVVSGRGGDRA